MAERRTFLKVVAGCAGLGATALTVGPSAALVSQPAAGSGAGEAEWLRVARLDDLPAGRPTSAPVIGAEVDAWVRAPDRRLGAVWLLRDGAGGVKAFSAVCPHLGCMIDLAGDHFMCPCHDSAFSLAGERSTGPSPRGMDPLEVRVADGWVSVRYQRFRLGVPERAAL